MIDLRSDTVTRPTPEMRRAMASAEVGDDVLGDDPTVNRLEERSAELTGKPAALFVPTGSMGNLVALAVLARAGEEVLCDPEAHFLNYEGGGVALLGVLTRTVGAAGNSLDAEALAAAIRPGDDHSPRTAAVVVENTHTTVHGRVLPLEALREIAAVCRAAGVAVHVDGARIFNAQVAAGVPVAAWAECADTLTFCFSKGLGAPAGSMVCGSAEAIAGARIVRKRLGGAMRQAGVLAAAADVALDTGVERLADDHARARRLAEAVHALAPGAVDPDRVQTNIVYVNVRAAGLAPEDCVSALEGEGVLARVTGPDTVRFVTHRDVGDRDLDRALSALRRVLGSRTRLALQGRELTKGVA